MINEKLNKFKYLPVYLCFSALILISSFIIFCAFGCESSNSLKDIYIHYTVIAIFVYAFIFLSTPKRINGRINIYLLFVAFTIPFYWGGQLLILLGFYDKLTTERYSLVDGRIENQYIIQAMQYVIICLLVLHFAYLLFLYLGTKKQKPRYEIKNKIQQSAFSKTLYKIALLIVFVSFIPTMARLMYDVVMAQRYGHLDAYLMRGEEDYLGIWYIFTFILGWFLPSCYMVLITSENKKINYFIYFSIGLYCILYLMCGSRYQIIEIVISLVLILFYCKNKTLKPKTIVMGFLFLLVLIIILRSVSYTRDKTGSGLSWESIKEVLGGGIIYESLFETSTTFTSIANIFKHCPSDLDYNYGASVLGSIYYIFPAFMRPDNDILLHISTALSPLYYGYSSAGYGSAFITEAYFNYSYFAYIFVFFIGYVLYKITFGINTYSENKKVFFVSFSVYLFTQLIWGIRSDLYLIPRHLIYYIIIPCLIAKLIVKERSNGRNKCYSNLL